MSTLSEQSRAQGQFYNLVNLDTDRGPLPVDLAAMKNYLRLSPGPHPDDDLLTQLLNASTEVTENYMGRREIRPNTWTILQDELCPRIPLLRDPVASITSVSRFVDSVLTAVSASVYVLVPRQQFSEIVLAPDESWPTDQDEGEQQIQVVILTDAHRNTDIAISAIERHVSYMYENRGDCDPGNAANSYVSSGALALLGTFRIKKI